MYGSAHAATLALLPERSQQIVQKLIDMGKADRAYDCLTMDTSVQDSIACLDRLNNIEYW